MTPENFAYWLQGFAELHKEPPTQEQWDAIKEHLTLVFTKVTGIANRARPLDTTPLDKYFTPNTGKVAIAVKDDSTLLC